jgi:hypothetical protein
MLWLHRTGNGQSRRRARYALASAIRGGGRQIVDAVVRATPEDWFLAVLMDWSGGFWKRMESLHTLSRAKKTEGVLVGTSMPRGPPQAGIGQNLLLDVALETAAAY